MLPRPLRAPIAILATVGLLVAMTAIPAAAQSSTPVCTAEGESTGQVTEGATLSYDSSFVCTDAADAGTWFITVNVANLAESATGIELSEVTLSHTSPQPLGAGPAAEVTSDTLPLTLATDANGSFDAEGTYELATVDEGGKAILHLWVNGATDEGEPFRVGINVQVLGPGVEPDVDDENGDGEADGRPEWVPGPPPWVIEMLRAVFANGFPWGTDDFPPGLGAEDGEELTEDDDAAGPPAWGPGPPPWVPAPSEGNGGNGDSASDTEQGDAGGLPAGVRPGGPPDSIPGPPAGRP